MPDQPTTILEGRALTKRFPGVTALDGVSFTVRRGEIHALLGENGAGKSTLIKILTGVQAADEGEIVLEGEPVTFRSPREAASRGISVVPQDVLFVPHLSIGRNILLGLESISCGKDRLTTMERQHVRHALDRLGARFSPDDRAGALSVPELRLAQIARFLIHPGDVLLLDEPTAVLSEADADHLLDRLDIFREEGKAVIYVTHRLGEVLRIADRATVLRDGRHVCTLDRKDLSKDHIVDLMADRTRSFRQQAVLRAPGAPRPTSRPAVLEATGLSAAGLHSVSVRAEAGQIVGIAGAQGSGHGRLLQALAGAIPAEAEGLLVDQRPVRAGSLDSAYRAGVLLVPGDRKGAAMVGTQSIRANVALTRRARRQMRPFGLRRLRAEGRAAREYITSFSIRTRGTETWTGTLSGGNQQKVALARALEGSPRVLLVEEPTQGIDVGAKHEIRRLLAELVEREQCAVIIATSEFEELLGLADVIHVMCLGRLVARLDGSTATYRDILHHALP